MKWKVTISQKEKLFFSLDCSSGTGEGNWPLSSQTVPRNLKFRTTFMSTSHAELYMYLKQSVTLLRLICHFNIILKANSLKPTSFLKNVLINKENLYSYAS